MNGLSPRRVLALAALVAALGSGGTPSAPWPHGEPPSSSTLDRLLADAMTIEEREQNEEWLAAAEANEDSDHLTILQEDVDKGTYTKEKLFQFGDEFFSHEYKVDDGYGDGSYTTLRRVHTGVRGGLDTFSCSGCHSVGGPDGAGSQAQDALLDGDGDHESTALHRNAPAMLGLGMVQALGVEMTQDLQLQRDTARDKAKATGVPQTVALTSKGISFGTLTLGTQGGVDVSRLAGVDADLVVKPFGWKGTVARLRRFVEDAARIHFGIQSQLLALGDKDHPDPAHLGSGVWYDPDGDGKERELEEGLLTSAAVYLTMLETPVILPPNDAGLRDRWANGSALFTQVGCGSCHTRSLNLLNPVWHELSDTTGSDYQVQLFADGDQPRGTNDVNLFSDLKRHAMGSELADPHDNEQGIARDVFLTRPLWGLAETPPYLHDGRAPTIPDAILAHGGEAQKSRDAFAALSSSQQADVHIFLLSLTREPKVRVAR